MKKSFYTLLSLLAVLSLPVQAQDSDVATAEGEGLGFWTGVEGSTKLAPGLGFSFEAEYRARDNFSATDRTNVGVSFSYKNKNLIPWLKVDAGYTFIYNNNPASTSIKYEDDGVTPKHMNVDANYWGMKHRATASLIGSWKVGRVKLSLRERYQYTYRAAATCDRTRYPYGLLNEYEYVIEDADPIYGFFPDGEQMVDTKNPKSDHKLRSRLAASYDIRKCKFEPFAEIEFYHDIDAAMALDKTRYTVGTDYKLSKTQRFTAYYRYQDHSDDDEAGGHVIGLTYSFDF